MSTAQGIQYMADTHTEGVAHVSMETKPSLKMSFTYSMYGTSGRNDCDVAITTDVLVKKPLLV